MAVEYKQYLRPASIPGRKIFCCLCSEDGVWNGTCLEKFAARFPDAKERYLEKANEQQLHIGYVLYCKGKDENTLVADMICRTKEFDKFKSNVHYGYLYGCLLQVVLKAQQANATVIVAELGIDLQEWQWRKLKPILEHAVDETDKKVRVVVASPYDLVEVEDGEEHHASKRKTKRSKDVPAAESKKDDSNEQLSLF